jgi:two-component system NtrC family sensor kinase
LLTLAIIFAFSYTNAVAQPISTDSLHTIEHIIMNSPEDTNRVIMLRQLGSGYLMDDPERSRKYLEQGLTLSIKLNYRKGEADCLRWIGNLLKRAGRYPEALDNFQKALGISESIHDLSGYSAALGHIGDVYDDQKDYIKARDNFLSAKNIDEISKNDFELSLMLMRIGKTYMEQGSFDSAMIFYQQANKLLLARNFDFGFDLLYNSFGQLYMAKRNDAEAMIYFRKGIPYSVKNHAYANLSSELLGIADIFKKAGQRDSSIAYARQALLFAQQVNFQKGIMEAGQLLSNQYDSIDKTEAYHFFKISVTARDSMFNAEKVRQVQNLVSLEQQRQHAIEQSKVESRNKIRLYGLLFTLTAFLFIAISLYVNNRNKQKANNLLKKQKEEIQRTLTELKITQNQLIHSEKMASLGELTAGIAHEIQNPLNFVNNFSELNAELIDEMQQELKVGSNQEAFVISKDIRTNLEKINQHGKRADAIVKSMLEHSRVSNGTQEAVNINNLVDEYLRLAYLGARGKDRSLTITLKTEYDQGIGEITIIPQDIGRVILNLISNAFYAVNDKEKKSSEKFEPTISVSTKKLSDKIEIRILDNGNGIPQKMLKKIFQPFFTTKPAGQGTGLGLSLAFDIVKAHAGDIRVESNETEFTAVIVELPLNRN